MDSKLADACAGISRGFGSQRVWSRKGPIESAAVTVNPRNGPVDVRNGLVDPRNGPVDPRNGPVDPRNGPVDPRNGPVDARNGPVVLLSRFSAVNR